MKHLILGSSGQIGTALTKYLRSIGEKVIEFDIKRNIDEDLRYNTDNLESAVRQCDFVYFLAFDVGVAKYLDENQNKYNFIRNNMLIMSNVFMVLNQTKKPFIFASSPNYPTEGYGMLKQLGEKMTVDLGGVVTRFWNVYDKEDKGAHAHVITDFIEMAVNNGVIKMRTEGYETRQFLYGEDCAEALFAISKNFDEVKIEPIQNITSFKWYTIKQVANIVSELYGYIPIIPGNKSDGQNYNRIEPYKTSITNFWKSKTELKDGIRKL